MKKAKRFLTPIFLVISLLLASCAGAQTTADSTDTSVSDTTDNTETEPQRKIYDHVLIIGVDGAGAYFKDTYTPNLDRIFGDGNVTYEARSSAPTERLAAWTDLLHGVEYSIHRRIGEIKTPYPVDSDFPSVFRAVLEQNADAKVVSVCRWKTINNSIVEDGIGIEKITVEEDDLDVAEAACEYINENGAPELMFVSLDYAFGSNHSGGWGGAEHLGAISRADVLIGAIYDCYEKNNVAEDTLFIVTSNHGGNENGYGGNSDGEKNVMFAVAGESVIKNGTAVDMAIRDVAAITMYALGLESPENWTARVPAGIFEGVGGEERTVYLSDTNSRYIESTPTPKSSGDKYVTSFIKDKELECYLTFDGTVEDSCGNSVEVTEDYSYTDGVFGEGIYLDNGCVTVSDQTSGGDSFTFAMWVKLEEIMLETPMLSCNNSFNSENSGFDFSVAKMGTKIGTSAVKLSSRSGDDNDMRMTKLPQDYLDGWMHIILTYNADDGTSKLCLDFGELKDFSLKEENQKISFEGIDSFCIGRGQGDTPYAFNGAVDEFMKFDGCFTEEDVASLAAYYGK